MNRSLRRILRVIGVVLGGGTGTRLSPLTTGRAKPAVPLAGNYRLVDVPISNCINSEIFKIYLLTQYRSTSLHRHIQSTYQFDQFSRGFAQILAAEQKVDSSNWFQGTADAVRQSMSYLASTNPDLVVILSGDQLCRIDFTEVLREHCRMNRQITVCATPVQRDEAKRMGILVSDAKGNVHNFLEKPGEPELDALGPLPGSSEYLASMGIYVFDFQVLEELLSVGGVDFGHHIFPRAILTHRVGCHVHHGYWKDIGTIGSYWKESIALTRPDAPFQLYQEHFPIYTRPRFLPPSRIRESHLHNVLISEGASLQQSVVSDSIIGLRSIIGPGCNISQTVIMGSDEFETEPSTSESCPLGIGAGCRIERAIIDKNVRIGRNVSISPHGLAEGTYANFSVHDGVIVIHKGCVLPNHTILGTPAAI